LKRIANLAALHHRVPNAPKGTIGLSLATGSASIQPVRSRTPLLCSCRQPGCPASALARTRAYTPLQTPTKSRRLNLDGLAPVRGAYGASARDPLPPWASTATPECLIGDRGIMGDDAFSLLGARSLIDAAAMSPQTSHAVMWPDPGSRSICCHLSSTGTACRPCARPC
jgi:hypothetical protein